MATTANARYSFEISGSEVLAPHPKSGLHTVVVQGICSDAEGGTFDFVATNNLDMRYPERFKVNWNGNKARMPEVVGHGLDDERKAGRSISEGLYFTRGARIAIARKCKSLFPLSKLTAVAAAQDEEDAS